MTPADSRPHRRASDQGFREWLRENWMWIAPLMSMLILVTQLIGFKLVSPRDDIAALKVADIATNRRIDSLSLIVARSPTVDSLRADVGLARRFVVSLVRDRCMHITAEAAFALNIPCDSLLRPYGVRQPGGAPSTRTEP